MNALPMATDPITGTVYDFPRDAALYVHLCKMRDSGLSECASGHVWCAAWESGPCSAAARRAAVVEQLGATWCALRASHTTVALVLGVELDDDDRAALLALERAADEIRKQYDKWC